MVREGGVVGKSKDGDARLQRLLHVIALCALGVAAALSVRVVIRFHTLFSSPPGAPALEHYETY